MAQKRKKYPRTFVKAWRALSGFTQNELGRRVGLDGNTIARIERGEIGYTQETFEDIARELKCSAADLTGRDPTAISGADDLWTVWDMIPPGDREQALRVLRALAKKKSED